jgi:flagellar motor switch protein FliN/FliY
MKKIKPKALYKVPLTIDFEFGRVEKQIGEILEFKKNTIVKLENSKKNVIQIYVNGSVFAEGKVLSKNGEIYVQITDLLRK